MSTLADMEELLASISNKDMVDYMREALICYGASAYRGCIVMSYLALFDDLKLKLGELAKINGLAKTIWQEVERRSGNQEIFESIHGRPTAEGRAIDQGRAQAVGAYQRYPQPRSSSVRCSHKA